MDKKYRILIADDDKRWADFCARKLRNYRDDLSLEVSYTVEDSLLKIDSALYDLVFCDYKMEYRDASGALLEDGGYRICGKAKSYPQVKVIMVTAYGSSDLARTSLVDKRFDDYLEKADEPETDILKMRTLISDWIENWGEQTVASNPFHAQLGQQPNFMIANRKDSVKEEMDFLLNCIRLAEQNSMSRFLLLGQWGMGKSCLMLHYKNYLQKRGYLSSYCKVPSGLSAASAMDAATVLLLNIIDGFPRIKRIHFTRFFESIKKMGFDVSALGVGGHIEWEPRTKAVAPYTLLVNGLNSLIEDLKLATDIVTILLDDLQNLEVFPEVLNTLLNILSEPDFVSKPIIFGASLLTGPDDRPCIESQNEQFVNRFFAGYKLHLTNFTAEETHELLLQTLAGTGVTFEEEIIDDIYDCTRGHPFLTQLLAHHLYDSQIGGIVNKDSFKKALQISVLELGTFFQYRYGELSDGERIIIRLIAEQETIDRKNIQHYLIEKDLGHMVAEVLPTCQRLVEKNVLLQETDGSLRIADYLYREFISIS